jgi:uncharacterized protein (DUF58 family)
MNTTRFTQRSRSARADVPAPVASGAAAVTPEHILRRLEWQVIRRLDGQLQGDYRSLFYGYGVDFADLREYQPEDDIRYIDWNVTARMDTPYVRQYMEDREITAWFLVDLSPSMDYGTATTGDAGAEKRAVLIDLVGALSRLLTRHGNRVGAILYGGPTGPRQSHRIGRFIPAKGGRNHVLWLIKDLLEQPRLPRAGFTDLKAMLEGGLASIKKRSLVFVLSDFISVPGWERTLSLLNHRHEVLAIRLWDPSEVELPDVGPMWMEDAETGEQLYVDTHDPGFRVRFAQAARDREHALNTAFRRAGVEPWDLSTREDLVRALMRFASIRKRIRRGQSRPLTPGLPGATAGLPDATAATRTR